MKSFLRHQFPALAWAGIIFFLSSIPANKLPNMKVLSLDKLAHISVFFILGVLVYRALNKGGWDARFSGKNMLIAFAVVSLYGILDELYQGTVPGRTLDFFDAIADAIGGLLAGISVFLYYRFRQRSTVTVEK